MKVKCIPCGNEVEIQGGNLRNHRVIRGSERSKWCEAGGKPLSSNQRQRDEGVEQRNPGEMHQPKPYTGELAWKDDTADHEDWGGWLHPFVD